MKISLIIASVCFIIAIPLMALTAGITAAVNSVNFYTSRFEKHNVIQRLERNGLTVNELQLEEIARGFIRYFNSGEEFIDLMVTQDGGPVALFNEEETIHFRDVKLLFVFNYRVFAISLVYILIYASLAVFLQNGRFQRPLARNTVTGSGLTLGLMLLLGTGFLLDFDGLFYQFHLISFSNTFWSAQGNMLLLFPQGFWIDAARFCAIFTAAVAVVLGSAAWVYLRMSKPARG